MKIKAAPAMFILLFSLSAGCGFISDTAGDDSLTEILPQTVPLAESPHSVFTPSASGVKVKKNYKAEIDYSHTEDGYVMVRYAEDTAKALRVITKGPGGEPYTYILRPGSYEVFPLSDGNGEYQVGVYENVSDNKYSTIISLKAEIMLDDEFAPFLRPNQYVNYTMECEAVKIAAELIENADGLLEKIAAVYNYVTENITYDKELAASVQSGYLPDIDAVLKKGKGICFDYAAVTTAMLRIQQIPVKLIVGYNGGLCHAWINAYSHETGWIDGVIYFDGTSWKLMDPTFSSNKNSSADVSKYIGDERSYTAKYQY